MTRSTTKSERGRSIAGFHGQRPDVCLVLEGTYPFVPGGVSSWVHHLITRMPDLSFGILHLTPCADYYDKGFVYPVPENVIALQEVPLSQWRTNGNDLRRRVPRQAIDAFWTFIEQVGHGDLTGFDRFADSLDRWQRHKLATAWDFLLTPESWQVMLRHYEAEANDESFLNFFWTWHYAYQPLLNTLMHSLPEAGVFHAVSTGYAGILAATASQLRRRPMVLTEHGIYTKERRIEIYAADWIPESVWADSLVSTEAPYFRDFWNRHFQMMSRVCYEHADEIYTLYNGNALAQVSDGADPDKCAVIPNGIDLVGLQEAAERLVTRASNQRFTVGFIGRVCPIKDLRTLLAAMRLVAKEVPDVRVRILGPMEEDPDYARSCRHFAAALSLEQNVQFEGRVAIAEELPTLDVVVLTSISEAQPLVVLEAGAVGLPVVTTNVGACKDLLEGRTPEDRGIGLGGLTTPIASPGATAAAVLELYRDPELRATMGRNLQTRVRRFYGQEQMLTSYREIYDRNVAAEDR